MIREATLEDVPALVEMGARFLTETGYTGRLAVQAAHLADLATRLIVEENGTVFVSEIDGVVTGMVGVLLFAHPMSGQAFASELFWWVEPEFRGQGVRLMRRAEQWARASGAVQMQVTAPTLAVEHVYQRLGFDKLETVYQRSL